MCHRDICSRMHTFLLESRRPAKSGDRASLILVREGSNTIIRYSQESVFKHRNPLGRVVDPG